MGAVSVLENFEVVPNTELKSIVITLPNTTDAADTTTVTLANYGINPTGLLMVEGWKHTTDGSVIVEENPTTAVSAGVLTITVPAGTDNDYRVYRITGKARPGDFS